MRDERGDPPGPVIDWDEAERRAALLDGRLDERARAGVMARFAADDEGLAAYAEAAAVTRALEEEDAAAGVTPLRRPSSASGARRWGAVAAVVGAVALAPLAWNRLRTPGLEEPGALAERLASAGPAFPAGWDPSPWGSTRSASDPLTPRARAVRIGARLVELELGLRAGDPGASRSAAQIAALLDEPGAGAVIASFRHIQSRAGAPWAELEPLMEEAGENAAAFAGEDDVRLGAWLQAARIAAARRDPAFFRTPATDAALGRLQDDAATRDAAERIRALTEAEGAPDWVALERSASELLAVLGR